MNNTSNLLVATFEKPASARETVLGLLAEGIPPNDLGVAMADSAEARELLEAGPGNPGEAAIIGSAVGGTLFGLGAVAMAGPFGVLAVGPMIALLGGATAGAGAGGLLGAFVGLGIPKNEAALRVKEVQDGGVLVTCSVDDEQHGQRVRSIFDRHEARSVFDV